MKNDITNENYQHAAWARDFINKAIIQAGFVLKSDPDFAIGMCEEWERTIKDFKSKLLKQKNKKEKKNV